jgi:hypothetical protein
MGELTPAYSCLGLEGIAHIRKLMPSVKLIFLLRDPVQRAWSHARMDLMHRTGRKVTEVPEDEFLAHFASSHSRVRGDYIGAIDRWLSCFPTSQMFLGYYDEVVERPRELLARILDFLEVENDGTFVRENVGAAINVGVEGNLAPALREYLVQLYADSVRELASRFGSYPRLWLSEYEKILAPGLKRP